MKRSQMVEVIEEALYCYAIIPGIDPSRVAETIMQSIEGGNKTGIKMLPDSFIWNNGQDSSDLEKVIWESELNDYGNVGWEEE